MGASLSDVNVTITADARGVGAGVAEAQRHFSGFANNLEVSERKVKKLSNVGTQAAFGLVSAFSSGGVSDIAESTKRLGEFSLLLGGVKTSLVGIGLFAVGNFIAKQFADAEKGIGAADDALKMFKEHLSQVSGAVERNQKLREAFRGTGDLRNTGDAFNAQREAQQKAGDLRAQLADVEKLIGNRTRALVSGRDARRETALDKPGMRAAAAITAPEFLAEVEAAKKRQEALREEIAANQKLRGQIKEQLDDQEKINAAIDKRLAILKDNRRDNFGGIGGKLGGRLNLDAQIAELRAGMLHSFGIGELFSRFPGANAMGSVGAVSTISGAKFGPSNVQSAEVTELKQQTAVLKRIEELEKKKASLEVVPL